MAHKYTNRLIREASPYLQQHAHNPVDWYPWEKEVFARAGAENKPVLLSIGYSAYHWCHVMEHESAHALVALGNASVKAAGFSPAVQPLSFETVPFSRNEVDYPAIRAMHEASSLESEEELVDWRSQASLVSSTRTGSPTFSPTSKERFFALRPLGDDEIPRDTIEEVIQRRGSSRESISFIQLSTILDRATRGIPTDFLYLEGAPLNDLYLIVHAVEDLSPGAYVFHRDERAQGRQFSQGGRISWTGTGDPSRLQRGRVFPDRSEYGSGAVGQPGLSGYPTGGERHGREAVPSGLCPAPRGLGAHLFR
jgi:hypothetical protein